jgi:hypothetical protein
MGATGADGSNGTDGVNGAPGAVAASSPAGTAGAAGSTGADGTVGTDGTSGADGTDGTDGTEGATGPAGPESMVSSGVFTLQASNQFPDTHAYLPLSGALVSEFVAPVLDRDAEVTEAEHTSMEQVIAQDETVTDIVADFGSTTDLGGHLLTVELTLLVSSGGTDLLVPAAGCIFAVDGNGPTSNDCSLSPGQAVHMNVGDVAVNVRPSVHDRLGAQLADRDLRNRRPDPLARKRHHTHYSTRVAATTATADSSFRLMLTGTPVLIVRHL